MKKDRLTNIPPEGGHGLDRKPNTMGSDQKITAEAVISKLKDDGDFDRLRLKTVRQLKQNEDLRNNIISVVKQAAALNCDGAENMKPRQLCDAIHDEVRDKVMNQISDALWEIIRSSDGMKTEITETIQSVYNQLLNPEGKPDGESPRVSGQVPVSKGAEFSGSTSIMLSGENNGTLSDGEVKDPPGFSLNNHISSTHEDSQPETQQPPGPSARRSPEQGNERHHSNGSLQTEDSDRSPPPGFSSLGKRKQPSNGSDEDPDIPPGFG